MGAWRDGAPHVERVRGAGVWSDGELFLPVKPVAEAFPGGTCYVGNVTVEQPAGFVVTRTGATVAVTTEDGDLVQVTDTTAMASHSSPVAISQAPLMPLPMPGLALRTVTAVKNQ